jgi:hypothetical protein
MLTYLESSPFPFYCKDCGLVEANTALRSPVCPKCKTTDILQYGRPPISLVPKVKRAVIQNFDFKAFAEGNLCPQCKDMTMVFSHAFRLGD